MFKPITTLSLVDTGFRVLGNPSSDLAELMESAAKKYFAVCGFAIVYDDPQNPLYVRYSRTAGDLVPPTDCDSTEPQLWKTLEGVKKALTRIMRQYAGTKLNTTLLRIAYWIHPEARFSNNPKYMDFRHQVTGCPRQ